MMTLAGRTKVLEYELPAVDMREVTLELDSRDTRLGNAPRGHEGLSKRLQFGVPILSALKVEGLQDNALVAYLSSPESQPYRFYVLHLGCTFVDDPQQPFERCTLAVELRSDQPDPGIAWSLDPLSSAHVWSSSRKVSIGPKVQFMQAQAERGDTISHEEPFIEALGLQQERFGWEFQRTRSRRLSGTYRLDAVVRVPKLKASRSIAFQISAGIRRRAFGIFPYKALLPDLDLAQVDI